jgi:hypothetical protein
MQFNNWLGNFFRALMVGLLVLVGTSLSNANAVESDPLTLPANAGRLEGIVFICPDSDLPALADTLNGYLQSLGVAANLYSQFMDADKGTLQFLLNDRLKGTDTLSLIHRLDFDLREELVQLPRDGSQSKTVVSVSKKEILLALLQRGRTTQFSGLACTPTALMDQVGIRQNIVAWSELVELKWPNGRSAHWNAKYWDHGNLKAHQKLNVAVTDVFLHPRKYAIGCYTATKLIVIQGVLDYYRRIKKDIVTAQAIEARLMHGGDPLSYIEPGAAWYFEKESTEQDRKRPGKLVSLLHGVAADNFIPGDWSYFLNTDPVTYQKTGYEGSNSIYLGRGKFDDYYNDNNHSYTYKEKLHEVYQWRHKVFSRERDVAKVHPLSAAEFEKLGSAPEHGGLELDYRMAPYNFGFAELPPMAVAVGQQ